MIGKVLYAYQPGIGDGAADANLGPHHRPGLDRSDVRHHGDALQLVAADDGVRAGSLRRVGRDEEIVRCEADVVNSVDLLALGQSPVETEGYGEQPQAGDGCCDSHHGEGRAEAVLPQLTHGHSRERAHDTSPPDITAPSRSATTRCARSAITRSWVT